MDILYILAVTETEASGDLLGMLGIDIPTLIFQLVAFLILVLVLSKWVYPIFIGIIDKREADIAASVKAADQAKKKAEDAESEVAQILATARSEASEIVVSAKEEANLLVETAEQKAKSKAETIVEAAKADVEKDIAKARESLKTETVQLVAKATELVITEKLTGAKDEALIKKSLEKAAN
ncbi:MAG: F0F1 ATP synthase subunit B [Psychrobacter sp.]